MSDRSAIEPPTRLVQSGGPAYAARPGLGDRRNGSVCVSPIPQNDVDGNGR